MGHYWWEWAHILSSSSISQTTFSKNRNIFHTGREARQSISFLLTHCQCLCPTDGLPPLESKCHHPVLERWMAAHSWPNDLARPSHRWDYQKALWEREEGYPSGSTSSYQWLHWNAVWSAIEYSQVLAVWCLKHQKSAVSSWKSICTCTTN